MCELVPAKAIAAAVGGEPGDAPVVTDPGFEGKGCRYHYRVGGSGLYTEVSLHPPSDFAFRRNMATFKIADVSSIGDAAFSGERSGQTDLYVLKRGDLSMHVQARGQNLEQAQAVARAVLERL